LECTANLPLHSCTNRRRMDPSPILPLAHSLSSSAASRAPLLNRHTHTHTNSRPFIGEGSIIAPYLSHSHPSLRLLRLDRLTPLLRLATNLSMLQRICSKVNGSSSYRGGAVREVFESRPSVRSSVRVTRDPRTPLEMEVHCDLSRQREGSGCAVWCGVLWCDVMVGRWSALSLSWSWWWSSSSLADLCRAVYVYCLLLGVVGACRLHNCLLTLLGQGTIQSTGHYLPPSWTPLCWLAGRRISLRSELRL